MPRPEREHLDLGALARQLEAPRPSPLARWAPPLRRRWARGQAWLRAHPGLLLYLLLVLLGGLAYGWATGGLALLLGPEAPADAPLEQLDPRLVH